MPVNSYFAGHGDEVLRNMIRQYGKKKGTQVFYATINARKKKAKNDAGRTSG